MDNFNNIYNNCNFYKSLREELIKDNEEIRKISNDIDNFQNILEKLKEINERLNIE